MTLTCPSCRHLVEIEPGESGKCGNCGARVAAPAPPSEAAPEASPPPAPAAPETPPTELAARTLDAAAAAFPMAAPVLPQPVTRPPTIVAFVFGLLFFIPFLTQLIAVVAGVYALGRRRQPDERVALAWIGLILGLVALPGWYVVMTSLVVALQTMGPATLSGLPPYVGPEDDEEFYVTQGLSDQMNQVHAAVTAFHRDFRRWPARLEPLVGRYLPHGFSLSERLIYRPVPPSQSASLSWILVASDELSAGLDDEPLHVPHRLVLRLGGKTELLPASDVAALLAAQPFDEPAAPAEPGARTKLPDPTGQSNPTEPDDSTEPP